MNCRDFNDRLHEYLDGTLDREVQAAAGEHLRQCGACRRALVREETVAKSLRHSLDCATADLSLRPGMLRTVLKTLESEATPPNAWRLTWQRWFSNPLRPIGASAALLGVLLLFLGIQAQRRAALDSAPGAVAQNGHDTWVIDVPIQTQTHLFRRENNTVVDAIAPSVAVGYARFLAHGER